MKRKSKLLLVLAASSLFAITSCSDKPSSSNRDDGSTSEVSKTYYAITLPSGEHYTISAVSGYDAARVEENKDFKFTIKAEEGYEISSVKLANQDGDLIPDDDGIYTIANVSSNLSITVSVVKKTFKVTFSGAHFTAEPLDGYSLDNIDYGGDFKFTIKLDDHYKLASVKASNIALTDANGVYTIENIVSNVVVNVSTSVETFAITATGEYASISALAGLDASKVEYGSDFKFTVATDEHYHIEEVKVSDTTLTAVDGVYTITNVTSNMVVALTAKIDTNSVRFEGEGFTVNPVSGYDQNKVEYGSDFKFKLTIKDHFHVLSVHIGDQSLTPDSDGVYTISNIVYLTTVTIATEEDSYKLSLPSGEHYTIELENPNIDLNKVGYSKEVKFKVVADKHYGVTSVKLGETILTADGDGYYSVKEQTSDAVVSIEVAADKYSIAFDSNGGTAVPTQVIEYAQEITKPADPTRAADEYYDSYTFDGWYCDGKKFDFASEIESDIKLVAKWKYGESKTVYVNDWNKADFVGGVSDASQTSNGFVQTIDAAGSTLCWESGKVNAEKKAKLIADFGKSDEEGVFFNAMGKYGTMQVPAINFKELLKTHSKIKMQVGGYQTFNNLFVNVGNGNGDGRTKINWNGNESSVELITRTLLTFMLGADGNVYMGFEDVTIDNPLKEYESRLRVGNVALSDAQANGSEGLIFSTIQGGQRPYWLGRPYAVSGESTLINASKKEGFSASEADIQTKKESASSGLAPYGQWYDSMSYEQEAIGIYGMNASGTSTLSIDPIDFSSLFASNKGVKFTLGAWNTDHLYYVGEGEPTDLGLNGTLPKNSAGQTDATLATKDEIRKSFLNWSISIEPVFGVTIHNENENTDFRFKLTSGQLNGTEPLKFNLGTVSNGHFFLLSNLLSYHI